jgi:transcriptional regulator with XRE-family HTH domain
MTLGDVIKNYRTNYNMSMDMFAKKSGISKAYISLLEKNKHPKTGKSIAPSIQCIKQAAEGMDMDFHVLFEMIDGNVSLTAENEEPTLTPKDNRDIAKDLNSIMEKLQSGNEGPASYDGEELSPEAIELFRDELEIALKRLKIMNKEKYTPKKYKK